MKQITTRGIILTRTDYAEADRIITFLTPDFGKLRAIAKGVRKSKSKLAGGIELFSVSELSLIKGRGEIDTLTSSRLVEHFSSITTDVNRTMLGYEILKITNKVTAEHPEAPYFSLLEQSFAALSEPRLPADLVKSWFLMQLLQLEGRAPRLDRDASGQALSPQKTYTFDFSDMAFRAHPDGQFAANHIKLLRLLAGLPWRKLLPLRADAGVVQASLNLLTRLSEYVHT